MSERINVTPEGRRLLEQVITVLNREPEKLYMGDWIKRDPCNERCGTTACIAGHVGFLMGLTNRDAVCGTDTIFKVTNLPPRIRELCGDSPKHVSYIAAAALFDAPSTRTHPGEWALFYTSHWPDDLQWRFEEAWTDHERAAVAIRRIRLLLDEGR